MYLEVLYHTIMPRGIELSCPMASNFDGLGFDSILDWFVVSCQSAVRSVTARPRGLLYCFIIYLPSVPAQHASQSSLVSTVL